MVIVRLSGPQHALRSLRMSRFLSPSSSSKMAHSGNEMDLTQHFVETGWAREQVAEIKYARFRKNSYGAQRGCTGSEGACRRRRAAPAIAGGGGGMMQI